MGLNICKSVSFLFLSRLFHPASAKRLILTIRFGQRHAAGHRRRYTRRPGARFDPSMNSESPAILMELLEQVTNVSLGRVGPKKVSCFMRNRGHVGYGNSLLFLWRRDGRYLSLERERNIRRRGCRGIQFNELLPLQTDKERDHYKLRDERGSPNRRALHPGKMIQ